MSCHKKQIILMKFQTEHSELNYNHLTSTFLLLQQISPRKVYYNIYSVISYLVTTLSKKLILNLQTANFLISKTTESISFYRTDFLWLTILINNFKLHFSELDNDKLLDHVKLLDEWFEKLLNWISQFLKFALRWT